MMERAFDAGIFRFFIPAIDSSYTKRMLDLETEYAEYIFLMMGLHPTSVKENYNEELAHVKEWIDQRNFYAIGEIGIDLYWDKSFLKEQQEAFKTQIQWAKEKKTTDCNSL
jgi:TatD DNase family protein